MIPAVIALLLLALALVIAELMVPSHGLLAIFAAVAAIASVILASKISASLSLILVVVIFITAPVIFYWAIRLYPKTPMGRRVLLNQPNAATTKGFSEESARLQELVGQQGVAMTLLRPAGSVEIAGQFIDALSESEVIAPQTPVAGDPSGGVKGFCEAGVNGYPATCTAEMSET